MQIELPSLQPLHKKICELDFYKDFKDDYSDMNDELEKRNDEENEGGEEKKKMEEEFEPISLTFDSSYFYTQEWEKLFFLEMKAQILRSALSESEEPEDYFLKRLEGSEGFRMITLAPKVKKGVTYRVFDLVLFTEKDPRQRQDTNLLTIVDYYSEDSVKLKCIIENDSLKFRALSEKFTEDSVWKIQKVCNLATIHREYQALYSIGDLWLKSWIQNPKKYLLENKDKQNRFFEIPKKLLFYMKEVYNKSQFAAIKESLKKEGITLIQGPPGTGKTHTILGVLSVLLNSKNSVQRNKIQMSLKKKTKA